MMGVGAAELVLLMLLAGGSGGMPVVGVPLPPDAGLQSAAPPECLLYAAHAGVAKPDAGSSNQVEQLLAESEIQAFIGEVDRLIDEGVDQIPVNGNEERTLKRALPIIGRTLLSRPSTLYVASFDLKGPGQVNVGAAFVVNAGDRVRDLKSALESLESLIPKEEARGTGVLNDGTTVHRLPTPPGAPAAVWGVKDSYVFLAVGEGEADRLVERLSAKKGAPEWLANLNKDLNIKRPSLTLYFNVADALRIAEPFAKLATAGAPPPLDDVAKLIDVTGLRHLRYVAAGSGLDDEMCVSKALIAHDGNPDGLLKLTQAAPLTDADLKTVPRSADFGGVGRFDVKAAYEVILGLVEQIEPRAAAEFRDGLGEAEEALGFSIEHDLLEGIGDTWSLYHSSEEGGLLLTGLCATVSVRDRGKIERVINRTLRLAEREAGRDNGRPSFAVRTTEVGGKKISYLQILEEPVPVAPAWCLTDDRLIVALSPQMVRAHITRSADAETLADAPEVKRLLGTGDVTGVSYANTQVFLKAAYSVAQYFATAGANALEKETGVRADLSKFPSLSCISRHMRPSVSVTRSTKTGLLFESYATGPGGGGAAVAAFAVGAGLAMPVYTMRRYEAEEQAIRAEERVLELRQRALDESRPQPVPQPRP